MDYVTTLGEVRPVNSESVTSEIARSARFLSTSVEAFPKLRSPISYFSKYIRIVAPAEPVPLNRKTTRDASPFSVLKSRTKPWFEVVVPSTGSVYLLWRKVSQVQHCRRNLNLGATYVNSSADTSLKPEPSSSMASRSPCTNLSRIKSIILLAAPLSTAKRR